jgi:hypothetical protein
LLKLFDSSSPALKIGRHNANIANHLSPLQVLTFSFFLNFSSAHKYGRKKATFSKNNDLVVEEALEYKDD